MKFVFRRVEYYCMKKGNFFCPSCCPYSTMLSTKGRKPNILTMLHVYVCSVSTFILVTSKILMSGIGTNEPYSVRRGLNASTTNNNNNPGQPTLSVQADLLG